MSTMYDPITRFSGEFAYLSNFFVERDGWTVEHKFQSVKTLDIGEQKKFFEPGVTAGAAKKLGRSVTLRPDWDQIRVQVMSELVAKKFYGDPALGNRLMSTGGRLLVEGNDWGDTFWGVDDSKGGQNVLGTILMATRATLAWRAGK